ncbi:MAG TPA: alpha/beta fold hydrolase [Pseudobdellovibrionaceae bacterium]|jgi:pimeloyl-ACP methyl ester carboxylesterase
MEKQNSKHNILFFHMGPGFHAKIEALQFSSKHPRVAFLDQPLNATFSELTDWACEVIRKYAQNHTGKVKLLGHSFGGQVIAAAMPSIGDLVSEIRFLNSAYDSFDCFVNLENTLEPQNLKPLQYWKAKSLEEKMSLIFHISQLPQFSSTYWRNVEARNTYEKISTSYPPVDIDSFVKAFSDYLQRPQSKRKDIWKGPTKIYYSCSDNLIKSFKVISPWKESFPNAHFIEVFNIGHHGLFESPQLADDFFKD